MFFRRIFPQNTIAKSVDGGKYRAAFSVLCTVAVFHINSLLTGEGNRSNGGEGNARCFQLMKPFQQDGCFACAGYSKHKAGTFLMSDGLFLYGSKHGHIGTSSLRRIFIVTDTLLRKNLFFLSHRYILFHFRSSCFLLFLLTWKKEGTKTFLSQNPFASCHDKTDCGTIIE